MNHTTRTLLFSALGWLAIAAGPAFAQTGTTSIVGRVTDGTTGLPLAGTHVTVNGAAETYTNRSGDYVLTGLPEGQTAVTFSYIGYRDLTTSARTQPGSPARLDIVFGGESDTVNLDEMVIQGSIVGTARAINQQRAATTLTNIIASDEIGRFPDQNAAEALQRVPGISLYRDQGEGRYIVVRGLNYTFTSVKVDGGSLAGADLGERATALDVIPADALASIEVTKVPTPDMDGEGLGGQVDIKTKSPFDFDGLAASATVQGQYSDLTGEFSTKFNGYVSQRFGDRQQFGLLLSPTWQERKFGSHNFETGGAWTSPDDNGTPFYTMEALEFRDYVINRERQGLNAAFEAKPDADTTVFVRGGYNRFTDTESRHLTIFDFTEGTLSTAMEDSATFTGLRRYGRRLRIREKDQGVLTMAIGGEKRLGAWTVDAMAGYTESTEERPDELTARFRRNTRDASIRYETDGAYKVSVTQLAGASLYDPASYNFQRVDLVNEEGSEEESNLGLNARYELPGTFPSHVKLGALFRGKDKESEGEAFEFTTAPSSFTFASLAEAPGDYPYLRVPRISTALTRDAYYANPSAFTGERVFEDSEFEDFSISEDILAAYAMWSATLDRLNVIGGVRVERTRFKTIGKVLDLANETATPSMSSRSYTNWLPGVHFRYDLRKDLVLRASWSNALARPSFGETAFRSLVNRDDLEITRGNPGLDALEAQSFDASIEYYLPSLGVLSAAVFHKEIDNFSYEYTDATPLVINGESYELTSYANGSDGSITGLELSWQQQLRMLPAPFEGLGVLANVTFLDSDATYPTRPGEKVPFIGQSDVTGNVGLTYQKGGLFLRLAMNFRSERLREDEPIGGSPEQDLYVDDFKQLDFTARYEINRNCELFAEMINITDEPFRVFLKSPNGQGARLGQVEKYGWSTNFGLRFKL